MKAVVIRQPGGPEVLEIVERDRPEPGLGEIRVRVRASALNRADLLQRRGAYPAPPGVAPDVPGLEYAGEVEAVGPGTRHWSVGDRVMGIVGGGAHAEFVCVHEREAIAVPSALSWEEAAAVPEVFLTAFDAFEQVGLGIGETVLIHAVGSGVGTAAVQLARALGATSVGTSRSADKLERCQRLGLDHGVRSDAPDWPREVLARAGGEGCHVILDLVGGTYFPENLRLLRQRGRLILVGTMAGTRAEMDLGVLLRKRATVVGTVLRSRPIEEKIELAQRFTDRLLPLFEAGRLAPVVDGRHDFREVVDAHRRMEANESFGKIVLSW
jgi:NADPH:quinone reductase